LCTLFLWQTLRYGPGIIFDGVRSSPYSICPNCSFNKIFALPPAPQSGNYLCAQLSRTITIPKCPKLALCVSLSSAFSRSLKTTPPRRAAESTMRRQPLCQDSHQHRKHAIIFICFLSAARLYIIHIRTSVHIQSWYALVSLAGKK
jgi:hypothetical protein